MQRQNFFSLIRFSRVLWLSLLVVMLGGLVESEAADQTASFGPHTDFGTGTRPLSVAVGDFNSDGTLDLAAANAGNAIVSLLLGTGTGSFGAKTSFGTGSTPETVAAGDFNGDGKLDLAVTNFRNDTVSILLNTVFSLGFDSTIVTAQAGTTVRVTVNINRSPGFTGNVTVTPPESAMGIKPKPNDPKTTTDTSVTFNRTYARSILTAGDLRC
jgi:FG-GAP-like repeat